MYNVINIDYRSFTFQVGACIVNKDKIIVGMGYNSMPYLNSHGTSDIVGVIQNDDLYPWERGEGWKKEKHNPKTKYPYGNRYIYSYKLSIL